MGREIDVAIIDTTHLIDRMITDYHAMFHLLLQDRQLLVDRALDNLRLQERIKELEDEIQNMSFITVGVPHGTEETDPEQSFTVSEAAQVDRERRVPRSMEADNGF